MKRINISLDDQMYERLRAVSFLKHTPISQLIRESLEQTVLSEYSQEAALLLDAEDETQLLTILKDQSPLYSHQEVKEKLGL